MGGGPGIAWSLLIYFIYNLQFINANQTPYCNMSRVFTFFINYLFEFYMNSRIDYERNG